MKLLEEDIYKLRKALLEQEEMDILNKESSREKLKHAQNKIEEYEERIKEVLKEKNNLYESLQKEYEKWHDEEYKKQEYWKESENNRQKCIGRIKELENLLYDAKETICQLENETCRLEAYIGDKNISIENHVTRITNLEGIIQKYEVEKEKWGETMKDSED